MSKESKMKKAVVAFMAAMMMVMVTGCSTSESSAVSTEEVKESITNEQTAAKEEQTTTGDQTDAESQTEAEAVETKVVEYGDTIQVCWELLELDAWVHIDPDTAGQHAILEKGMEIEFAVSDATSVIDGIHYEVSEHFATNVINAVLGKKVGDTVSYTEELDSRNYKHIFTITGINDVQIPSFCMPEDWEFQFNGTRIGNFFLANGDEADNSPHYGFEDKVMETGPIWGENRMKYYSQVMGTSILAPQGGGEFMYSPSYVATNDRDLTWCEGVDGAGEGEYIDINQMYLGKEADVLIFDELCIVNGYAKNEQVWKNNSRVKSLNLYYEDHFMGEIHLEDTMKPQYFDLTPLQMKVGNGREAHFRFLITAVYEGAKYDATCITGIEIGFTVEE